MNRIRPFRSHPAALAVLLAVSACGGGTSMAGSDVATEAAWRALREPRPDPLAGAPRVTLGEVQLAGAFPWDAPRTVNASLGLSELVVAGLLRRRDVLFVERRRFAAAAEAERLGARRSGQPPAGVSQSAEFSAQVVWTPLGPAGSSLDVRIVRLQSGTVEGATRVQVADETDPVAVARTIVSGITAALDEMGRLPRWDDPLAGANVRGASGVSHRALTDFLRGLAAEEVWRWEEARRGYQAAAAEPGFHEARTVLARAARLRLGGTLAES